MQWNKDKKSYHTIPTQNDLPVVIQQAVKDTSAYDAVLRYAMHINIVYN